ncbi:MAG: hypothetical protein NVSMB12_15060 [Acidimicrobiales bacterium]
MNPRPSLRPRSLLHPRTLLHREPPAHDPSDDITAIRAVLHSADPVTSPGAPVPAPPGWSLVGADAAAPVRRRAVIITALATAAALVAAVVAAGVVGGGGNRTVAVATSPRAVLAASSATVAAGSATGHLVVALGSTVIDAHGTADLATGDADLTVNLPAPLGPVEVVNAGGSSYLHVPNGFTAFTAGKPWVKIDRSALGRMAGPGLEAAPLGGGVDFQSALGWLRGAADVTSTGPGRFHAVLDLTRAVAQAPVGERDRLQAVANAINQAIPANIRLDGSGRLTHLDAVVDLGKLQLPPGTSRAVPASGTLNLTLDLQNFGTAFHVSPPPPDQVADAPSILSLPGGAHR